MKTFDVYRDVTVVVRRRYRVEAESPDDAHNKVAEEGVFVDEEEVDYLGNATTLEEETEEVTAAELRELEVDDARHKAIIELARNEHEHDGEVEIDDDAKLSEADDNPDNGCYVQAWVWVSFGGTPYDKEKEST